MIRFFTFILTFLWWAALVLYLLALIGTTLPEFLPQAEPDIATVMGQFNITAQQAYAATVIALILPFAIYAYQNLFAELIRIPLTFISLSALAILLNELPFALISDVNMVVAGAALGFLASFLFQGVRGNEEKAAISHLVIVHAVTNAAILAVAIAYAGLSLEDLNSFRETLTIWAVAYPLAWRSAAVVRLTSLTRATEAVYMSVTLVLIIVYIVGKRLKRLF